jgi:two-component system response regulator HydG
LTEHFARKLAIRTGRLVPSFSLEARDILCRYNWPGNARELANAIERSLIVADSALIRPEDLPMQSEAQTAANTRPGSLAEIERAAILEELARHSGDRRATAEALGISLRTLQYRLKEYGMAGRD